MSKFRDRVNALRALHSVLRPAMKDVWRLQDAQGKTAVTANFSAWCVIATETSWQARELPYAQLPAPTVVAIHPSRQSAESGANAAILMREACEAQQSAVFERERAVREKAEPGSEAWNASVAHEIAIRNKIAIAVAEAAQPREAKG